MKRDLFIHKPAKTLRVSGTGLISLDAVYCEGAVSTFTSTGGSCANVLTILRWLSWDSWAVGRVGVDAAGKFIAAELSRLGVRQNGLFSETNAFTPVVIQRNRRNRDGEPTHRFSFVCPHCGKWLPRYRPITLNQAAEACGLLPKCHVFYFDRVSPGVMRLAHHMKAQGSLLVFEPSGMGDERCFKEAVEACDVLKYSTERLGHLTELRAIKGPHLVVETHGRDGLEFRWRGRWSRLSAFAVEQVSDTAGAGDWCTAGLLHELGALGVAGFGQVAEREMVRCLEVGQALAAINCQFHGARGIMRVLSIEQLKSALSDFADANRPISMPIIDHQRVDTVGSSACRFCCTDGEELQAASH